MICWVMKMFGWPVAPFLYALVQLCRFPSRKRFGELAHVPMYAISFLAACYIPEASAQIGTISSKVKTSGDNYLCVGTPGTGLCSGGIVTSSIALIGFTLASPAPIISPNSTDPRAHTTNPLTFQSPRDMNGNGSFEAPFTWKTLSLLDVGTYHYRWTCTYTLDTVKELPCPDNGTNASDFDLVIFNSSPTASVSLAGVPAIHGTVTLNANSGDADGGALSHSWRVMAPTGHAAIFSAPSAASTKLTFVDERDIGAWRVEVDVDDDEGERKTFSISFTVPNLPPSVSIVGASNVDALQPIRLKSSTMEDPDGGPPLTLKWNILESPPLSSVTAPYPDYHSAQPCPAAELCIPTTEKDIGRWKIELVATDNEGASDSKTVEVAVANLPPKITLSTLYDFTIKSGEPLVIENTTPLDPDGGTVTHDWELVQVPVAAGVMPKRMFGSTPTLNLPAPAPGTWIFKLHVIDNDNAADSEVTKDITVHVDAPVRAGIADVSQITRVDAPLQLDGSVSVDPDHPCVPGDGNADCSHISSAGMPQVKPGIVSYSWTVIDIPVKHQSDFFPGPVDYLVGVVDGGIKLNIPAGTLRDGNWTFQLEVVDADGNRDATTRAVQMLGAKTPPTAIAVSSGYVLTDLAGKLSAAVGATAFASFDLDNTIVDGYSLGLGIKNYAWQYRFVPYGCLTSPPPLRAPPNIPLLCTRLEQWSRPFAMAAICLR